MIPAVRQISGGEEGRMQYENGKLNALLKGRTAGEEVLRGRGFRKDVHRHFGPEEGERVTWFKTFSVGLDACCQEAYYLLGLEVGPDSRIMEAGAAVLYMEGGSPCGMFVSLGDGPAEADVDDLGDSSCLDEGENPWPGAADGDGGPAAFDAEDADNDEERDDEEDDDREEDPYRKTVMDIIDLKWVSGGELPWKLEHEAAMLVKGRWLPAGLDMEGLPLPRLLERHCKGLEAWPEDAQAAAMLEQVSMDLDFDEDSFDGSFDLLCDRGTRYLVCRLSGSRGGADTWEIESMEVDSYTSTGSKYGNLFNRPRCLDDNPHDHFQANLLLADCCDDAEFKQLLAAEGIIRQVLPPDGPAKG